MVIVPVVVVIIFLHPGLFQHHIRVLALDVVNGLLQTIHKFFEIFFVKKYL
jgi:hypothetical protein